MAHPNSIAAFNVCIASGFFPESLRKIFEAVVYFGPITYRDACAKAGVALNSGTPRFRVLIFNGLIRRVRDVPCPVTGKTVSVVESTGVVFTSKLLRPPPIMQELRREIDELRAELAEVRASAMALQIQSANLLKEKYHIR